MKKLMILSLLLLSSVAQAQTITSPAQVVYENNHQVVRLEFLWDTNKTATAVANALKVELNKQIGKMSKRNAFRTSWNLILKNLEASILKVEITQFHQNSEYPEGYYEAEVRDSGDQTNDAAILIVRNLRTRDEFIFMTSNPNLLMWAPRGEDVIYPITKF